MDGEHIARVVAEPQHETNLCIEELLYKASEGSINIEMNEDEDICKTINKSTYQCPDIIALYHSNQTEFAENDYNFNDYYTEEVKLEPDPEDKFLLEEEMLSSDEDLLCNDINLSIALSDHNYISPRTNDLEKALLWLNVTLSKMAKDQHDNKFVTVIDQISNIINTLERILGNCSPSSSNFQQALRNGNAKKKIELLKTSNEIRCLLLGTDAVHNINSKDMCSLNNCGIDKMGTENIDEFNKEKYANCQDHEKVVESSMSPTSEYKAKYVEEEHCNEELNYLNRILNEDDELLTENGKEKREIAHINDKIENNIQHNITSNSEKTARNFILTENNKDNKTDLDSCTYEDILENSHCGKEEMSINDQTKLNELLKFGENLVSHCKNFSTDKMCIKNLFDLIKIEFNKIFYQSALTHVGVQTDYINKPLFNEKQRIINEKEKEFLMKSSSGESEISGDEFEENVSNSSLGIYSSEENLALQQESLDSIESSEVSNEHHSCDSKGLNVSDYAGLDKSTLDICVGDIKNIGNSTYLGRTLSDNQDSEFINTEPTHDEEVHEGILSQTCSSSSIIHDEKLNMEPLVLVEKLREEDLTNYYYGLREKQIDRLLNFNTLEKRRFCPVRSINGDKINPALKYSKRENSFDIPSEDDLATDESSTEEIPKMITEKEYLARCNENFKQHFLNIASSESDINSEQSACEGDVSDSSFDSDTIPIVDKFLGNISHKPLQKDMDIVAPTTTWEIANNNTSALVKSDTKTADIHTQDENSQFVESIRRYDQEEEPNKSSIGIEKLIKEKTLDIDFFESNNCENTIKMGEDSEESDCEILHSSALNVPRKVKSYESLIAESDKRRTSGKITEELINLSSESASELEEIVNEDEFPKRVLKPMLRQHQLAGETRLAQKEEAERIKRLDKKVEFMAKLLKEYYANKSGTNDLILDYNSETKEFIYVHKDIVKQLKAHQIDGVKFMYDTCYGSVEFLRKHPGSGCILAHCMGLGKTLQLIALLHTVISYKELKTNKVLVLCPKSTVMNWKEEIQRWLGPIQPQLLKVYCFPDASDVQEKLRLLQEWSTSGSSRNRKAGCFLMGYEAFRTLVFYHLYKKQRSSLTPSELELIKKKVKETLLQPGADLVICDEGHIIKNRKSAISTAVAEIKTLRRIILTGTPIQNNLKEYYSMVNFIKPSFLGTEREFANLYANPIRCGQHKDSSKKEIKIMKQRSFVLHKKLSKFVQRREAALLKSFLPDKYEYVLFTPMTNIQNTLYEFFLKSISTRETSKGKSLIPDYTCLRKIWTHPKVLENAWQNAVCGKNKRELKNTPTRIHSDEEEPDDIYDSQTGALSVTRDWWRPLITKEDLESLLPSNKLRVMFEILRMCGESGEKCLIFSAFVAVLNVVEHFMKQIHAKDLGQTSHDISNLGFQKFNGPWIEGKDYYRLDGRTSKTMRHEMVKMFNNSENKRARCFLISAKAGGQGINLIGANRVIILDTSWNPSNDQQNIFRIFRLGQRKKCYVYRLLAMGTMEEKVYSRSVTKQAMSFRVVDEQQIDRHYSMAELAELYTLTKANLAERPVPSRPKDNILASLLHNYPEMVFKYHEHDSLLENKLEQELSEQEKADAWAAYEQDLQSQVSAGLLPPPPENLGLIASTSSNYLNHFDDFTARNFAMTYNSAMPPVSHLIAPPYNYSSNAIMEMLNMYKNYTVPLNPFMSRLTNMNHLSSPHHFPSTATPNILSTNLSSNPNMLPPLGNMTSYNNLISSSNALMTPTTAYSTVSTNSNGINASDPPTDSYKHLIEGSKINSFESIPSKNNCTKPQPTFSESIPTSVITRSDILLGKLKNFVETSEKATSHTQMIPQKAPVTVNPIVINQNKSNSKGNHTNAVPIQPNVNRDVTYLGSNSPNLSNMKMSTGTSLIDKTIESTFINGNITVRSVNSINSARNNSNYDASGKANSVNKSPLSYLGADKSNTSAELNKDSSLICVRKGNPFESATQINRSSIQSVKKNITPSPSIATSTQLNTIKTIASPHLNSTNLLSVKPQTMVMMKQNNAINANIAGESNAKNTKKLLPSNSTSHSGKLNRSNSVRMKAVNPIENLTAPSVNFSGKQNFVNPTQNNMRSKEPIGIFNSNINKVNQSLSPLGIIPAKKSRNQINTSNKNNSAEISNLQSAATCAALNSLSARSNLSIKPIENKQLVTTITKILPEHKNHTSITQSNPVAYSGNISLSRKDSRKRPAPTNFNSMLPENPPMSAREIKRSKTLSTHSNNLNVRNTPEPLTRIQAAQNLRGASRSLVNNQRLSHESILNEDKIKLLYKSSLI